MPLPLLQDLPDEGAARDPRTIVKRRVQTAASLGALVAFAWLVWPTAWRYDALRSGGQTMPLRTHRITGRVEYLTPSGWLSRETSTSSSAPPAAAPITSDDLSQVEGRMGFEYAGSTFLRGSVYNGLPRDLVGDVLFHVEIRDASGKMTIERDYRESVHWPAQQTSDVIIQTDFAWEDDSALEWRLEPAPPK